MELGKMRIEAFIWRIKSHIKKCRIYKRIDHIRKKSFYNDSEALAKELLSLSRALEEKGCEFLFLVPPEAEQITCLSNFEIERINNWTFDFNNISEEDARIISKVYDDYNVDEIVKLYEGAKVIEKNGHKFLTDYKSKYVNIENGIRYTINQPNDWKRRILLYGACTVRGTGVEDCDTISSYLQGILNKLYPETYVCMNYGIGCNSSIWDDIYHINNSVLYENDIIVLCNISRYNLADLLRKEGVMVEDSSIEFNRPHEYGEWFTDNTVHTNKNGNRAIATFLFKCLENKGMIYASKERGALIGYILPDIGTELFEENPDFISYIDYLNANKVNDKCNNGAIVMNCNPFTNGHLYLIEKAADIVDTLYIFVVEENKSFFSFEDRFSLVCKGVERISNAIVLKSGKFIISAITFPGYFYKDNNSNATVDTSLDIGLFGKRIAPVLGITKRFAGEEPFDLVTRQYNDSMRILLPFYGIQFIEIPRKDLNGNPISASDVRKAIERNEWKNVKKLVPETTYNYLEEKYGRKGKE